MKITEVETFLVPPRWLFLRLGTDDGLVGWGEPIVEGRAETVARAIHEMRYLLIGQDPLRIEDLWQILTRASFYRGGPILSSAVAGIDQALWDIAGKYRNAPVHELLGGPVRNKLRVYAWVGGDEPAELADETTRRLAEGFTAVKLNAVGAASPIDTPAATRTIVRRAEQVREVLGDDHDLAIDFHGRLSTPMARRTLAALESVSPLFVEEPVRPEFTGNLAALTSSTCIPLATGERLYSRWDFHPVLMAGIAVAQPDISHAGGISEVRRIAAMAEVFDVHLAPHCPLGPIALAASVQLSLAIPNFLIHELGLGIHYNGAGPDVLDYLVDPEVFTLKDGFLSIASRPGLGIDVDEAAVRRAAEIGHEWRAPIWRLPDGSLAEW